MGTREHWPDIRHVVFDWNGTLLDDLDLAVGSVGELCVRYGVPPVDRERYRREFRFPIAEFYRSLGFNFDALPFPVVMGEYLQLFDRRSCECPLRAGASDFLDRVRTSGRTMSVLSAAHQPTLDDGIRAKGLSGHFEHVCGLRDGHAAGKLQEARELQARLPVGPAAVLYVGDTEYDAAVAAEVGWHAAVLTCGHQDAARLAGMGLVVDGFAELVEALFGSRERKGGAT